MLRNALSGLRWLLLACPMACSIDDRQFPLMARQAAEEPPCIPTSETEVCDDRGVDENCDGRLNEGCVTSNGEPAGSESVEGADNAGADPVGTQGSGCDEDPTREGCAAPSVDACLENPQLTGCLSEPPSPADECPDQSITFDELYELLLQDLRTLDVEDRPFARYLTLANRYSAGVCGAALASERVAIFEAVNMLSLAAQVSLPVAVDAEETLYRLDIRDYQWDRTISVGGVDFVDGWEAIVSRSPFAVSFQGPEATAVQLESATDVTVLHADAFIDVALIGELYSALVDVSLGQTLNDFMSLNLGIDAQDNLEGNLVRAVTTTSGVSRQDRLFERRDIGAYPGVLWQALDLDANPTQSFFDDPLGVSSSGVAAMFSLPNGLFGFVIADASRNVVAESNLLLDTRQADFVARTAISCSSCHAGGLLPATDEMRQFAQANSFNFSDSDLETIVEVYVPQAELDALIENDSRAYLLALERLGVPSGDPDPVVTTFLGFQNDVSLARGAGDLGLTPDALLGRLNELDPVLLLWGNGTVGRDDLAAHYVQSLCELQRSSRNRPTPAACAGGN